LLLNNNYTKDIYKTCYRNSEFISIPFGKKLLPEYVTSIFIGAAGVVPARIRWIPIFSFENTGTSGLRSGYDHFNLLSCTLFPTRFALRLGCLPSAINDFAFGPATRIHILVPLDFTPRLFPT
jgi:hypothetical protein